MTTIAAKITAGIESKADELLSRNRARRQHTADLGALPSEPREIPADEVEAGDVFEHAGMTNTVKGIRRHRDRVVLVVDTSAGNQLSWPFANDDLVTVVLNPESQAAMGHDLAEPMVTR